MISSCSAAAIACRTPILNKYHRPAYHITMRPIADCLIRSKCAMRWDNQKPTEYLVTSKICTVYI